jgi:hypothetical protein
MHAASGRVQVAAPPIMTTPAASSPILVAAAPLPSAAQAQMTATAAHTSPRPIQIAEASPAPSMPGMAGAEARPRAALADAASDPLIENPRLKKLEEEIADFDFPVEELAAQWAMFEKECPEPTTDAMCLDAKTKIIESTQKVFESKIKLLDQKIAILETVPQNAIAQQETDESEDTREKMKVALDSFPKVLAHLNKVLNDLKHANDQ